MNEDNENNLVLEFEFDDLVAFGFSPDKVFLLTREHHDTVHCHVDLESWSERSLQGFLRAVRKGREDVSFYRISDLSVTRKDGRTMAFMIRDLEFLYDPGECEFSCQDQDLGDLEKTGFDMELVRRTGNQELVQDDGKVLTVVETGKKSVYDLDDVVQVISDSPEFTVLLRDGSIRKHEVSVSYDQCPDGFIRYSSGGYGDNDSYLFRADLVRITGSGDSFRLQIPGFEKHAQDCVLFKDNYDDSYSDLFFPKDTHQVLRERGYGNLVDLAEADDEFHDHSLYANTERDSFWVNFPMEGESRKDQLCVSRFQLSQILFLKSSKEEEGKRLTLYFRDGSQRSTETGLDLDIGALNCPFVSFGKMDSDEAFWARPEDIVLRGPDRKISVSLRDGTALVEIDPDMVSPYLRASYGFMRLAEKSPKWELARIGFDRYGILDMPTKDHHLLFRGNQINISDMDAVMFYGLDLGGQNTFIHMFSLRKGEDEWRDLGTERQENLVDLFLGRGNPERRESFLREIRAACTRLDDNICEVYVIYDAKRFAGVTETHKWSRFSGEYKLRLEGENPVEIRTWPI